MFVIIKSDSIDVIEELHLNGNESPLDIFTALANKHHIDLLKVSGNVFPKFFYPNIDCPYTQHLFAVLLLKSIGQFTRSGKLENVHNLTRGTASDHDNIGIAFNFNGEDYYFAGITPPLQGKRIPHKEAQVNIVKTLHKMDLPYAIGYKMDPASSVLYL